MSANYIVVFTKKFLKMLSKLTANEQKLVMKKLKFLESDPNYPSLRSKKLEGSPGFHEFSVNMNIRVIWRYDNGRVILLLEVGGHDIIEGFVRNQR